MFPNPLLEKLYDCQEYKDLSGYEFRILLFIARVTYGFNRDYAKITYKDFIKQTKYEDKGYIQRCIVDMINKGLLLKKGNGKGCDAYYAINCDTSENKTFTKIPNTLLKALYDGDISTGLSGYDMRLILFIVRVTLGFQNRPYAKISYPNFIKATSIKSDRTIRRCLSSLINTGIVIRRGKGQGGSLYYSINKDTSKWVDRDFNQKALSLLSSSL
ncbi:MAG: replication protein [Nitrospirae bacterium]|nr:replication protein [Nitrospirota bacterium]